MYHLQAKEIEVFAYYIGTIGGSSEKHQRIFVSLIFFEGLSSRPYSEKGTPILDTQIMLQCTSYWSLLAVSYQAILLTDSAQFCFLIWACFFTLQIILSSFQFLLEDSGRISLLYISLITLHSFLENRNFYWLHLRCKRYSSDFMSVGSVG